MKILIEKVCGICNYRLTLHTCNSEQYKNKEKDNISGKITGFSTGKNTVLLVKIVFLFNVVIILLVPDKLFMDTIH